MLSNASPVQSSVESHHFELRECDKEHVSHLIILTCPHEAYFYLLHQEFTDWPSAWPLCWVSHLGKKQKQSPNNNPSSSLKEKEMIQKLTAAVV